MFYKKEQTVHQRLMFIHCGIQRYCDERQVTAQTQLSQGSHVRHIYRITVVQKALALHTKALFFQ